MRATQAGGIALGIGRTFDQRFGDCQAHLSIVGEQSGIGQIAQTLRGP